MKTPETANLRRPRRLGLPAVLLLCLGCLRFPFWASAQADTSIYEPYSITTLAGLALNSGSTDNTGNLARFNRPYGVAVDGFGTVYVADTGNHSIRKITSGGAVTLLAGIPGTSGSANGANLTAMFSNPTGVAVDSTGNVYVADYNNHLIRQISGGTVSTLAGSVGVAGSTDGTSTAAQFRNPFGVAVNSAGTVVYVSDMNNQTIRMITVPGGVVTTLTGSPNVNGSTDGPNNVALFNTPRGIAVDSGGNIFVSDSGNLTVRKILSGGGVSTLAGAVFTPGFNDGPGLGARFSLLQAISPFGGPCGVAVDAIGNVYVADQGSTGAGYTIRKITPGLSVTTLAGSVGVAGSTDATGIAVGFNLPAGVAVDSAGKIYVADTVNHTIRVGVDTNCGNSVPVITCPTNKMVNCGTDWTFDAPIATSACGTNLTVSVLHTVTNTGPCSTVITRTWQATSCFGAGMKSWSPLGAGLNGEVWALTEMGGNLYVGGQFTTAGGASANYIAKWNGTSWSQLGSGITNGLNGGVYALAVMGGKLFAAGYFTTAGGVTATNIAQWDGTSWSPLGTGLVAYSAVEALAVIGTDLYVGGGFSTADGGPGNLIAKYNTLTSVWSPLGSGMNDRVNSLTVVGTDLYAGGQFTSAGGVSANFVAKWNGSNWSALGTGMDFRVGGSLGVLGGNLYAGGIFTSAGGNSANRVARWDIANSIWSSVGTGINNGMNHEVEGFAVMGTDLYASGGFMTAGGVSANRVAQWNGSTWSPLGTGMNNGVWRLAAIGQDLYAGGIFTTAGGLSANYIAKWGADCIPISVTCSQTVTIVDTTPPVFTCTNPSVASFSAGTTSDNFVGPEPASPSAGLILRLQSNGVSSLKGFDDNCAINTFFAHTFTNLPLCITKATLSVRLKGCSSSQTYNDSFGLSFTSPSGALVPTSWSRYLGSHNSNPATGLFTDFDSGTTLDVVLDLSLLPNADGSTTDLIPTLNVQGFFDLVIQDDSAIDFAVLTVTSCCATETKTVECGTAWTFDAPTVSDSCSGTNVTLTVLSTVTNGVCPRIITRTWKATDACGNSVTNSQAVTVVDNMPPVLTCATNKIVQCGTAWIFDAPTASDACSTNVTISIFNTVTNGICPLLITRTWSAADACGNTNTCSQTVTVVDTICVACETWTPHETNRVWTAVASSADGSRLVATVHNGLIYTSGNAGLTWTPQNSGNLGWVCVASDSTGQHLVAAANPGQIYTSSNFGGSWTVQTSGNKTWKSVASDSTGQYLVAVADNDNIYTSSNSGGTWTARGIAIGLQNWHSVASSADGSKLVAVGFGIPIYTSTDFGLTWTAQTNSGSRDWQSVASSADGSKLVAGVYLGLIYTSGNAGLTWTHNLASSGVNRWNSIASSADGNKLVAVVYNGLIYCSTDSGVSWAGHESNRAWHGVAASSDASKLVAVVYGGGQIYTADCPPAFVLNCATNKTVQCGTAWTFDAPTVSDSCSGTNLTVSILSTVTNGVCPRVITRTWMATDACGNTNTCSQVVTVVDTTPPVLTCATNKTVQCGTAWTFDAPTVSDSCSGTNLTVSILSTVTNGVCPRIITRTWQATDACGNTNTCIQIVTVVDTIAPVLIGCQDIITNALHGTTGNYVNYSATAVDGCFGPVPVTFVPPPGSFFPVGTTLVIGTAVDACGNTKTCEFTVTVRPSAEACLNITREVITCLTNGGYSYTFSVTNLSTGPIAGFLFAGLPTGVTITPYEVVLPAALAPGQGTTVAVTISSTGCAPTNLCFRLSTYDEHFETCCFFQHCIALQGCCTPHTYTFDADFASGYAVNLNYTNVHDQLQINSKITTFPYVWIASGYSAIDGQDRGSVMKIDAITGVVLGEYRTAPTNSGLNPSRTTVDRFGNCWVANRNEGSGGQGSVAKVALIIGGTRVNAAGIASATGQYLKPPFAYNSGAIDRDNDGLIKTSMGLNNVLPWAAGTSVTTLFPSAADDEAITMFLRVPGSGARSLAVDQDNNLWVGGYSSVTEKDHQKFDSVTGLPLSGIFNNGSGGYGAVIDRNGILWSAGRSSGLFRMDTLPLAPLAGNMGTAGGEYGLSIDPCTDNLWHTVAYGSTNLQANGALGSVFVRGGPSGAVIAGPFGHGNGNAQGVCVDQRGNVFVAHSTLFGGATTVGRLTTSGCYVGNIPLTFGGSVVGRGPTGVAVGHDGKIWVSCYQTHNVLRIDPNSPANGFSTGCAGSSWPNWTPIGAVDLVVDLNANGGPTAWPYNYSDNTGFHALGSASPGGFWNVIRDGCVNGLDWGTVSWNSLEPAGTSIKVEVRASDTQLGLAGKPFTAVTKDVSFCGTGIAGRYLEIRTSFYNVGGCNAPSPVLYDLTVDCSCVPENHMPRVEKCPDPFFTPVNNASVTHMLSISVADVDGDPLTVTWSEGGVVLQTNIVPAGVPGVTTAALNFTHNYGPGHHVITILVNDGTSGVFSCTVVVQIGDSKCALITAPTGVSVAAFTGVIPNFLPGLMAVDDHTPTAQLVLNQRPLPGTVVDQGVHLVQLTARDLAGNTATSQTFYAVSPVVSITAPVNYATFTAPATISVATALAADVTGVARVRLLNGGAVVGTNNKAPYGFAISNLVAGTYLLTAQAVSTADLLSTSEGVIIDVLNPDAATPGPIITGVALTSRSLTFSLLTEPGVTFHVEYSETLAQPIWMLLRTIGGNGSVVPVTDETTNSARRFYRVRRQ